MFLKGNLTSSHTQTDGQTDKQRDTQTGRQRDRKQLKWLIYEQKENGKSSLDRTDKKFTYTESSKSSGEKNTH